MVKNNQDEKRSLRQMYQNKNEWKRQIKTRKRICCPMCKIEMFQKSYFAHVRRKHPQQMLKLGVKPRVALNNPKGYRFIAKMVRRCIVNDIARNRETKHVVAYVKDITYEIFDNMKKKKQYHASLNNLPCYDDWGGYLPTGFDLHSHSIFKLSLDRINNNLPHFSFENDSWLTNIRFIIHGMNHHTNPVNIPLYIIRNKMHVELDKEEQTQLIMRMQKTRYKGKRLIPYNCITNIRKTKDPCLIYWKSISEQWKYCSELLREQEYRCSITGILMNHTCITNGDRPFAPSLDAINPRIGHIPGNLRWICSFLNNGNCDKRKIEDYIDDKPTSWSKQLFNAYVINEDKPTNIKTSNCFQIPQISIESPKSITIRVH